MHSPNILMLLILAFVLNVMAVAVPGPVPSTELINSTSLAFAKRDDPNAFALYITNKCGSTKTFILTQGDGGQQFMSAPVDIPTGTTATLWADFYWQTMRVSGHGEWPESQQYQAQPLFEFGYAQHFEPDQQDGTGYDISIDPGVPASDSGIGIGVWPENSACPSKICWPWNCPPTQGFTTAGDVPAQNGLPYDPADASCYVGKVNFDITWCP